MSSPIPILRAVLKRIAEPLFGVRIYRDLPRGVDPLLDLRRLLPGWAPAVIFDVGANVGQSTQRFARAFPRATIHGFEPVAAVFAELKCNVAARPNVTCAPLAMGAEVGRATLLTDGRVDTARVVAVEPRGHPGKGDVGRGDCVTVDQDTVDAYARRHGISTIGYLKIDTEGADLEVLRGASRMVREERIDVIQVEAGIGIDNERHVPLAQFRQHLEERGYRVFGFYDQHHEWTRRRPYLRRTDVVFLSPALAETAGADP